MAKRGNREHILHAALGDRPWLVDLGDGDSRELLAVEAADDAVAVLRRKAALDLGVEQRDDVVVGAALLVDFELGCDDVKLVRELASAWHGGGGGLEG
jgi:hypothetical protein